MSRPEPNSFTLVFAGSIRKAPCNPLATETVYGTPYAAGVGDAFYEADQLREALKRVSEMGIPWEAAEYARRESTRVHWHVAEAKVVS